MTSFVNVLVHPSGLVVSTLSFEWSPRHTSPSAHTWHLPAVPSAQDNTNINNSEADRNTRITKLTCSWHKSWASLHAAWPNSPCSITWTSSCCMPRCRYRKTVQLSGKLEESMQTKSLAETVNYFILSFHLELAEILLQNFVAASPKEIQGAWYGVWDQLVAA